MQKLLYALIWLLTTSAWGQPAFQHLTVANGLLNNQVRQIVELPNHQILVATEGAFSVFNGREFVSLPCHMKRVYDLPSFGGHSYLWQGDSILWLKDFYYLYMYDTRSMSFRYDYGARVAQPEISRFIHEKGDSVTQAHVRKLDPLRPWYHRLTVGMPFHADWLQAYCRDRQGGQWIGLQSNGVLYLRPAHPQANTITPVTGEQIRHVGVADAHRLILAGQKGIYLFDSHRRQVVKTLASGEINCTDLYTDNNGRTWISTQQGLYAYEDGTMRLYNTGNSKGFLHNHIRFALPLDNERILVCNVLHELGYFYPKQRRFVRLNPLLPALNRYRTMIGACLLDRKGKVAVATQNGMFVLDTRQNSISSINAAKPIGEYSNKYNCMLRDSERRLWMGTQNGLFYLVPKHSYTGEENGYVLRRVSTDDGLSNACIQSIAEDAQGRIWVGTSHGVNRITLREKALHILTLGASDGIPQSEMAERGICTTAQGTICFVSALGLTEIRPHDFDKPRSSMKTVVVGLKVMGKPQPLDTGHLYLSHNENYIELQFSALNYADPEHTHYRYRMSGLEKKWMEVKDGRGLAVVRYNALAPGKYRLEMETSVRDGEWGRATTLNIDIQPPIWLTWWAKMLYIILSAALVYKVLTVYLKRRKEKMERENEEKINRLFELRDHARHQFAISANIEPEKTKLNHAEEEFVKQMINAISAKMDDCNYTVDQLATDIHISRAGLYKKTQSMLGITPNDFMRNVRLKYAAKLLQETNIPVNQISLMVGFATSRYFSLCFRKMFGVNPSEYRTSQEQP